MRNYALTVGSLIQRLQKYDPAELCCCVVWYREDFLACDPTLTEEELLNAMYLARHQHDATTGINWEYLEFCISKAKEKAPVFPELNSD